MMNILILTLILLALILFSSLTNKKNHIDMPNFLGTSGKWEFTIAVAGDIACDFIINSSKECQQDKTADLILKLNPDAVLTLGDLQYDNGTFSDYMNFYDKSWGKFKNITYSTLGNHDFTNRELGYFRYFPQLNKKDYYSFNLGKWHLVALNSNQVDSLQLKWLEDDLEKKSSNCTMAYFHHPLFSSSQHGPNSFVKPIWDILYKNKVEIVLNGHDHIYERFSTQNPEGIPDANGIRQFIVGTGGRSLYKFDFSPKNSEVKNNNSFGVLKLTLKNNSYGWEFMSTESTGFIDSGSEKCF